MTAADRREVEGMLAPLRDRLRELEEYEDGTRERVGKLEAAVAKATQAVDGQPGVASADEVIEAVYAAVDKLHETIAVDDPQQAGIHTALAMAANTISQQKGRYTVAAPPGGAWTSEEKSAAARAVMAYRDGRKPHLFDSAECAAAVLASVTPRVVVEVTPEMESRAGHVLRGLGVPDSYNVARAVLTAALTPKVGR